MSPEAEKEFRDWCVKERDDAAKSVAKYESGGMKIIVIHDDGPLQDFTEARLEEARRVVSEMDLLIAKMDADNANRT